jgi:phosphotriesterase-related protein
MKHHLLFATAIGVWLMINGCSKEPGKIIMTVTGPISPAKMGKTLEHEHLLVDFIGADSTGSHRWDREEVVERVLPYLKELKEYQVRTLIECTPEYVGRDPELLRILSKRSGIQLVTNTGYYGAHDNLFLPDHFYALSAMELSKRWTEEFDKGIGGTGIRPGFIKIAVAPDDTLSSDHEKIVAAAAMTHNKTGLVIASHTGPDMPAFAQIRILRSYGIHPSHFIWVHAQQGSMEGNLKAAEMGAWISLDNINDAAHPDPNEKFSTSWYADRINSLKEAGFLDRILISHDAGWYSPGEKMGGDFRGFTDIFTSLIPQLEERQFTQKEIQQLLVLNPREAFSFTER